MLDPQALVSTNPQLIDADALRGLNLIVGFTGVAEAGHVVSQIGSELLGQLDHVRVARFDTDQLVDYRGNRPRISFVGDHFGDYQAPAIELYRVRDGLGRPFLLLTGVEPDYQWERFCRAVLRLVERLDVRLVAWVQSLPLPVPHTRPIGVTAHGNRPELIEGITSWKPTADLQAGVAPLLEVRLAEAGRDVVGYSVHVPHYLADSVYPQAAVAALEYLGAATSLVLPTDKLREAGRDVGVQIAEQVRDSAEVARIVDRLEQRYDEHAHTTSRRSLLTKENDELPDADEIGAAVEAFLAARPQEAEGQPGAAD
ncbi:proteasome assembly chaperone family protein [Arthrobacter mobilis]|uniref:PAC2 family protein n=1 Tax=Arthrobacter mobilis TaxID=2724944 RepID=A0A7X6K420_9MICC|nr:PAC2 family protein [Arthrobacter mobilis]NKX54907.1 PAC2 family protein [Arthrobacter mobilis]